MCKGRRGILILLSLWRQVLENYRILLKYAKIKLKSKFRGIRSIGKISIDSIKTNLMRYTRKYYKDHFFMRCSHLILLAIIKKNCILQTMAKEKRRKGKETSRRLSVSWAIDHLLKYDDFWWLNNEDHASCFFSSVLTFPLELVSFTLICCALLTISALF